MLSFGLRCTKVRLATGLCPGLLGELTELPNADSSSWI